MVIDLDAKRITRSIAPSSHESTQYLGTTSQDGRVTLVTLDSSDPWEAFKAVRERAIKGDAPRDFALYESPRPVEQTAELVVMHSRRAI